MEKVFNYEIDEQFGFSIVDLKGEKNYFVEGYISTIDKDKSGEVISQSAQQDIYKQVQNETITMDLEHELWYDEKGRVLPKPRNDRIPVAKIVDARLDGKGVWVKAVLNKNLASFSEIWGSIKDGFLKAFSIAFYPISKSDNVIKSLAIVNVTLTGSPVNPNASFVATMKSVRSWMDTDLKSENKRDTMAKDDEDKKKDVQEEEAETKCNAKKKAEEEEEDLKAKKPKKKAEDEKEEDTEDKDDKEEDAEKKALAKKKAGSPGIEPKESEMEKKLGGLKAEFESIVDAKLKAFKDELAVKDVEIAKLKAELASPVMKSMVEETPQIKINERIISPLGMIR